MENISSKLNTDLDDILKKINNICDSFTGEKEKKEIKEIFVTLSDELKEDEKIKYNKILDYIKNVFFPFHKYLNNNINGIKALDIYDKQNVYNNIEYMSEVANGMLYYLEYNILNKNIDKGISKTEYDKYKINEFKNDILRIKPFIYQSTGTAKEKELKKINLAIFIPTLNNLEKKIPKEDFNISREKLHKVLINFIKLKGEVTIFNNKIKSIKDEQKNKIIEIEKLMEKLKKKLKNKIPYDIFIS